MDFPQSTRSWSLLDGLWVAGLKEPRGSWTVLTAGSIMDPAELKLSLIGLSLDSPPGRPVAAAESGPHPAELPAHLLCACWMHPLQGAVSVSCTTCPLGVLHQWHLDLFHTFFSSALPRVVSTQLPPDLTAKLLLQEMDVDPKVGLCPTSWSVAGGGWLPLCTWDKNPCKVEPGSGMF